jgi:integrase
MKGSLLRRGKNSWRLKYDAPPIDGARQYRYRTLKAPSKAQAEAEATRFLATVFDGSAVDPSAETVAQFIERWLADWARDNVSNKTWTRYAELLRLHIAARVGTIPIQKLQAAHLQGIYAAMAREGRADRTRLHAHRVISTMLKHAAQWGVVSRNVANVVDAPRVKAKEIEILTPAQVQVVLQTLHGKPPYPVVALMLATGMRRAEALPLRWQDVDLDKSVLRVERAIEQTRGAETIILKAPKTARSKRTITLAPSTVALLREHRKDQLERRLLMGLGKAAGDALVFTGEDGESLYLPSTLTLQWKRAMAKAGLKATLHSLRHTHASLLLTSGLDVLTVSRRLGHSAPSVTLNVYGHLLKPDDRAAAIVEAALAQPPQ